MKKFFSEFKAFITKGNVMSMAVGIIIGGAFTAIVNSLVKDIISPVIGILTGGINFEELSVGVGEAQIMVGNFINAVITFLLTALVLFWIVKFFNKLENLKKKEEEAPKVPEEPKPTEMDVLTEIRDLLKEGK
ncbi:MAG: large conductance mechanosensitive channel protein MscL [Clostridia bacterium]|nr:large conductance mechanosensitive channel protein MscL [Clostridia bacterium]